MSSGATGRQLPLRQLSIRVPWHDSGWAGRVCQAPQQDGACLILKRIAESRDDRADQTLADRPIKDLSQEKWPCCVAERSAIMGDFEYTRTASHSYHGVGYKSRQYFARRVTSLIEVQDCSTTVGNDENCTRISAERDSHI